MTAEPAVVCGGCGDSAHCHCVGLEVQPRSPYHCDRCLQGYQRQAKKDITLQREAMQYLYDGIVPDNPVQLEKLQQLSRWMKVDQMGDLVVHERDGRRRRIPLIGERVRLMRRVHE